jgi:DNA-directed RNA polymerase beta' subunit
VIFADKLMYTGFSMATRAGLSIAVDDMLVPKQKDQIIGEAETEVQEIEKQYTSGLGDRRASATTRSWTSGAAPATSSRKR